MLTMQTTDTDLPHNHEPMLCGALAEYATVREVKQLPLTKYDGDSTNPNLDDYLRLPPRLFPDPLYPLIGNKVFGICDRILESLWIDISLGLQLLQYTPFSRLSQPDARSLRFKVGSCRRYRIGLPRSGRHGS